MKITVYIIEYSTVPFIQGFLNMMLKPNIWEHNAGLFNACARDHHPVKLVYHEKYDRLTEAVDRARQMKDWDRAGYWRWLQTLWKIHPVTSHCVRKNTGTNFCGSLTI